MIDNFTKSQIINAGIRDGKGLQWIDNELRRRGYTTDYNPFLMKENWKKVLGNVKKNAKELPRDLISFSSLLLEPAMKTSIEVQNAKKGEKLNTLKRSFKEAVNNDAYRKRYAGLGLGAVAGETFAPSKLGAIGGAMTGFMMANSSPEDVANAMLSPYNITTKDIKERKSYVPRNIAQGFFDNPLYALLDLSPAYAKPLGKAVNNIPEHLPYAFRQFIPNAETRKVSRQLTNTLSESKNRLANRSQSYQRLESSPLYNREEMLKNLMYNTGKLDTNERSLTDLIKSDLKANEQEAIRLGLISPENARANTVAQYVVGKLNDERILHKDIFDYLTTGIISDRNIEGLLVTDSKLRSKIANLINEGDKLYKENKINYFTQALAPTEDRLGRLVARDIAKVGHGYFGTNRIVGLSDVNKLAKVFDDSLRYQINQVDKFSSMEKALQDISDNFGLGQIKDKAHGRQLKDGGQYIGISLDKFREGIKDIASSNSKIDFNRLLKNAESYDKGAIIMDKLHFNMIENAFNDIRNKGLLRNALNIFKKVALASPHWVALNRVGNYSNNILGGVRHIDYLDAWKYRRIIPERLKQQTSFNSYTKAADDLSSNRSLSMSMVKQPINRILRGIDKFNASDAKRLEDYAKLSGNVLGSVNDFFTNPYFKIEAFGELMDRSANFISKAKKLAKKENKDWRDIVRQSGEDNKLFNKINTMVNKDLGDYIGRNYAMPNKYYDALSALMPFYRFITQTGRTTAHQLAHNPLGFATSVTLPARYGNPISEDVIRMFNLDPEKYKGGLDYLIDTKDGSKNVRTFGYEPLPIGAVLGDIFSMFEPGGARHLVSPFLTIGADIMDFRKNGRKATTREGIIDYKNYKPTSSNLIKNALDSIGKNMFSPYRQATGLFPEIMASMSGDGLYSRYDTDPFTENVMTYRRDMPIELLGRNIGILTNSNYVKKPKRKGQIKNEQSVIRKQRAKVERREAIEKERRGR